MSNKSNEADDTAMTGAMSVWQLPNLDDAVKAKQVIEEEVERLPTAEEIEAIRIAAHEEGKAQGYQEGMNKADSENQQFIQQLNNIIRSFEDPLAEQDQDVSESLTELALAVTKQIVRREVKSDPKLIIAVVRDSLKTLPAFKKQVVVHLHPEDAQMIRKIFSLKDNQQSWSLSDDPSIERGGCIITTQQSTVDASIDKRVTTIFSDIFGDQREEVDDNE